MGVKIGFNRCENIFCLFKEHISPQSFCELSNNKNQIWYEEGETILREGFQINGGCVIQSGAVKFMTSKHYEKQLTISLAKEGSFVGYLGLLNKEYNFNIVAIKPTIICFIGKNVFENICKNNPNFTYEFLHVMGREMATCTTRMQNHSMMNIREKVAEAFVYINNVFGINPKTKILNIPINRQLIAELAGTTVEQVARQLGDFEEEGLISRQKRLIRIVNLKGLQDIIQNFILP